MPKTVILEGREFIRIYCQKYGEPFYVPKDVETEIFCPYCQERVG